MPLTGNVHSRNGVVGCPTQHGEATKQAPETREAVQLISSQKSLISINCALADTPVFCRDQEHDENISRSFSELPRTPHVRHLSQREKLHLPLAVLPYHILISSSLLVFTVKAGHVHPFTHLYQHHRQSKYSPWSSRENPEENTAANQSSHGNYQYHNILRSP